MTELSMWYLILGTKYQVPTSSGHPRFQGCADRRRVTECKFRNWMKLWNIWKWNWMKLWKCWCCTCHRWEPLPQHSIRFIPPSLVSMRSSWGWVLLVVCDPLVCHPIFSRCAPAQQPSWWIPPSLTSLWYTSCSPKHVILVVCLCCVCPI